MARRQVVPAFQRLRADQPAGGGDRAGPDAACKCPPSPARPAKPLQSHAGRGSVLGRHGWPEPALHRGGAGPCRADPPFKPCGKRHLPRRNRWNSAQAAAPRPQPGGSSGRECRWRRGDCHGIGGARRMAQPHPIPGWGSKMPATVQQAAIIKARLAFSVRIGVKARVAPIQAAGNPSGGGGRPPRLVADLPLRSLSAACLRHEDLWWAV